MVADDDDRSRLWHMLATADLDTAKEDLRGETQKPHQEVGQHSTHARTLAEADADEPTVTPTHSVRGDSA